MASGSSWTLRNLHFWGSLLWLPYMSPQKGKLLGVQEGSTRVKGFRVLGVWGFGGKKVKSLGSLGVRGKGSGFMI